MQDTGVQQALKKYVSDGEPAMGLTADAVLAAGRRSRRSRRVAGFAGAGLAIALAGAGVVVVSGGGSSGPAFEAATPCPIGPGPRPAGAVAADRPFSPAQARWAATSLTCYLNEEVPRL